MKINFFHLKYLFFRSFCCFYAPAAFTPPGNILGAHFFRILSRPRIVVRLEWNRTRDLLVCTTVPYQLSQRVPHKSKVLMVIMK
jgi:hypothetical protein